MRLQHRIRPTLGRLRALFLAISLAFISVGGAAVNTGTASAETGGYPYAEYAGPGTNAAGSYWTDPSGNPASPYGYYYRNCTDFVAWKLATTNDFPLPHGIGNGADWGNWAASQGYAVNDTPAVGAVAWWAANTLDQGYSVGAWGHVAWVSAVSGTNVTIQEYNRIVNGVPDGAYHTRTMTASNAKYIHFKDTTSTASPQGLQAPSAVVDTSTGRNIFYVGADNAIWQWSIQNNAWNNFKLTGGGGSTSVASGTSPSAIVDTATGRNVFYVGADNAIWQWSVQNGQWFNFRLGGSVAPNTSPTAIVDSATGRNIFYVGSDNQIWQWSVQNGQWNNFKLTGTGGNMAAATGTSPSAIVDAGTGRNVFYFDNNKMVWQWSIQNNAWNDFKLQ